MTDRMLGPTIELWLDTAASGRIYSPATMRVYRHNTVRFVAFVGPARPLHEVSHLDITSWMASMNGIKGSSMRARVACIRSFFGWCIKRRWLYESPMDEIKLPRSAGPQYRALDGDTIDRLLFVADFREKTMALLGLHLGLRCCEMARADVTDWSRHQSTMDVRGKGYDGEVSRVLPILGEMEWALDLWVGDRRGGPLFDSQHADRLTANSISQIGTRLARRAGVRASFHQLRHTAAHDLVAGGAPLATVQRLLGHKSLQSTTRYLAANDKQLRSAMGRSYLRRSSPTQEAERWVKTSTQQPAPTTDTYIHALAADRNYLPDGLTVPGPD